ncbi:unnamed protein product, partial [Musa acuminata subsp. burmannicoides]
NIWWCARFGRGTWSTSSPSLLPSWIASLTSPSTRSFPASTELGGHTVFSAQPALRLPQGQRRQDGARPTRPHLFDAFGDLPDIGTGGRVGFVWEFNFREFDVRRDPTRRTPSTCSAQWHRLSTGSLYGIDSGQFAAHLHRSTSSLIAVSAARTLLDGSPSQLLRLRLSHQGAGVRPASAQHPGRVPRPGELALRETVDLKHMMRGCKGLSGGLEKVASTLGVPRQAGKSHQAGSDSLVTCQVYLKMKQRFFDDQDKKVACHRGIIYGLQAS